MADKDRQEEADESRDDENDDARDDENDGEGEASGAEDSDSGDEPEAKAQAKASSSDEGSSDDADGDDSDDSEAAARVAAALGVGEEAPADEAAEEEEAPKAPPNRAARRREEALGRRRKKKAAARDDEPLPKDKNARAKELLARRKEQASERRPVALLPGEMVEDALSRMTAGASRWIRKNFSVLQWVVLAAILGTGGVLFYVSRSEKKDAGASGALADAVAADRGKVLAEDKRSDEEKELDTTRIFKTAEERSDTALAAYNKVVDEHSGASAAATLAKLGQAGVLLDKKDYAHALDAYAAVKASPLAGADPDVKGRAMEGIGFAKEGKGDLDGALEAFREIESIDAKGFKELSLYHQARIQLAKGDKEKAKELLKSAREKLQTPSVDGHSFQFLEAVVDETLRRLDPSAVPARAPIGGPKGSSMTQEEIQELLKRARENAEKKKKEGESHDE